jgi:NAD(P)-dependent dehydrogenase (short-subunit alcohol dehydrogenase family)
MKSFAGKVAAVTGAGSGIGRSLALALARRGCHLALSDVDERTLAETAAMVEKTSSVRVTRRRVDVSDRTSVEAWADEVVREHGRCNLIFNNAGIAYASTVAGGDLADLERVIDVNYWGVVYGTRAFFPHLRASGDGHVINISSLFGLIAFPGQSAYNASKFAVRGFTEALRIEVEMTGAPVGVTCVHPGGIKTNIARAAKSHSSLNDLGIQDVDNAGKRFERAFRVSPDDAAQQILRGVQKNRARVLIGRDAQMLDLVQRLLPSHYHGFVACAARRVLQAQRRQTKAPASSWREQRVAPPASISGPAA